ncbi:MAG TPA: enolase C-terminal domain-like protein [Acidimicrobiales bacterium]|nr:enolase C-terminal domain-like protein [Acidimicrobiales bacterium]
MTPAGAIRFAKRIEAYDPLWFEEPVPPENMAALAEVARATSIPITTGERLTTKHDSSCPPSDRDSATTCARTWRGASVRTAPAGA